jgi:cytochrome c peroxidase
MWDGREPTFESQAIDATLGHAQALSPPTPEQVAQIVQFEKGIFSAQLFDLFAGALNANGAHGGPVAVSAIEPGQLVAQPFDEYSAWSNQTLSMRRSIARGENVFNARVFTISNVSGFNNAINNNAFPGTCATCHNVKGGGNDIFPFAQRDIGIGGQSAVFGGPAPAADLPIFRVTCKSGFAPPFDPPTVLTNDPGRALISGKCADIGARTVPTLRGLVSHPPFFSDGSAATVSQLVDVYNKRFGIGLTAAEKIDLVNFLKAL